MPAKSINSLSQALDDGPPSSQGPTLVPPSQSHFAKFKNFTPQNDAPFEDEFARLASSQNWVPGSQQFKKERTIAMREELTTYFFSAPQPTRAQTQAQSQSAVAIRTPTRAQATQAQSQNRTQTPIIDLTQSDDDLTDYSDGMLDGDDYESVLITATQQSNWPTQQTQTDEEIELTPEQIELQGFQDLCDEVEIGRGQTIDECKRRLKATLVNIVDLIDARRTGNKAEVWTDWSAFKKYTLQPEHRIDQREAELPPGYLAALLQDFKKGRPGEKGGRIGRGKGSHPTNGKKNTSGSKHDKTHSGRVEKRYSKGAAANLRPDCWPLRV